MTPTAYQDDQDASWASLADRPDQAPQATPSSDNDLSWWPLALSETLKSDKPLGVSLGDRPIVLWRDAQGKPRAMADQCPHRRVPLSLGRLTADGLLQCGYHGWCFDGETGRVRRIPNMLEKQRIPAIYRGQSYGVSESGGFIRVCLDKDTPVPQPNLERLPLHGTTAVGLVHAHYVAMLFDDPSLLIDIPGVEVTEFFGSDLTCEGSVMTLDRHCVRRPHLKAIRERSSFPFVLRVKADIVTGETNISLLSDSAGEVARMDLAPTPGARGTTTINWRASAKGRSLGGILRSTPSIHVRHNLDIARIAATRPAVSIRFETEIQLVS